MPHLGREQDMVSRNYRKVIDVLLFTLVAKGWGDFQRASLYRSYIAIGSHCSAACVFSSSANRGIDQARLGISLGIQLVSELGVPLPT